MPVLSDLAHVYGGDIGQSSTGDIAMVSGSTRTTQRVIRRLITAATTPTQSDYPWEPRYGEGLGAKVGATNVSARGLQASVRAQLLMEASVAKAPAPSVTVTEVNPGTFQIDTSYTDQSGSVQAFQFYLSPSG